MSVPTEQILTLIVLNRDVTEAEAHADALRKRNIANRSLLSNDGEQLRQFLHDHPEALVLHCDEQCDIQPGQLINLLRRHQEPVPCFAYTPRYQRPRAAELLDMGFLEVFTEGEYHLFINAIRRHQQMSQLKHERQLLRQQLQDSENRFTNLLAHTQQAIAYIQDGMFALANNAFIKAVRAQSMEELSAIPFLDLLQGGETASMKKSLKLLQQADSKALIQDCVLQTPKGKLAITLHLSRSSLYLEPALQIILQARKNNEQTKAATVSPLPRQNSSGFIEGLRNKAINGMLLLSLDLGEELQESIKNDDGLLRQALQICQQMLPAHASLALVNSNLVISSTQMQRQQLITVAETLCQQFPKHLFQIDNRQLALTLSIGLAWGEQIDVNSLFLLAQKACQQARNKGGNQFIFIDEKQQDKPASQQQLSWQKLILHAIENNRFQFYYQPIVALHADNQCFYEALLRLRDDEDNVLLPHAFMPHIIENGLQSLMDKWVATQACRRLKQQQSMDKLFIKLSDHCISDNDWLEHLQGLLRENKIKAQRLVVELDAENLIRRPEETRAFASQLQNLGVELAIDHFGQAPDAFQLIKSIPGQYLKIEAGLIDKLADDRLNQLKIRHIAEMSRRLERLTIAQNVQDAQSLALLWQEGINYIEGFYLQEPSPAPDYDFENSLE